ncbi:hypothetical protein TWF718_006528, partial [Orbilia javanica]
TSTHGVGVLAEEPTQFTVQPRSGYAIVSPTSAGNLSGNFHFTVPRPQPGYNNIVEVKVEFTSQSSTVDDFSVYFGNKEKIKENNIG